MYIYSLDARNASGALAGTGARGSRRLSLLGGRRCFRVGVGRRILAGVLVVNTKGCVKFTGVIFFVIAVVVLDGPELELGIVFRDSPEEQASVKMFGNPSVDVLIDCSLCRLGNTLGGLGIGSTGSASSDRVVLGRFVGGVVIGIFGSWLAVLLSIHRPMILVALNVLLEFAFRGKEARILQAKLLKDEEL